MTRQPIIRSALAVVLFVTSLVPALGEESEPLIKRLDDATRAKVLAALVGLIILGFAMVLLTWLGARITQRYRCSSPFARATPRPTEHEWTRKPLPTDDPPGTD